MQTPLTAVRGSPTPRATPASAGGAPGLLLGHLHPQGRWWRGGVITALRPPLNGAPTWSWSQGLCSSNGAGSEPAQETSPKGAKAGGTGTEREGLEQPRQKTADLNCKGSRPKAPSTDGYGHVRPDRLQLGDDRSHPTPDAAQPTRSHQAASPWAGLQPFLLLLSLQRGRL